AEMTRRSVTVALTGDGGDELLAGYRRYPGEHVAARYRAALGPLAGPAAGLLASAVSWAPSALGERARRLGKQVRDATLHPVERYLSKVSHLDATGRRRLMPGGRSELALALLRGLAAREMLDPRDPITLFSWLDTGFRLPNQMLVKVDRMTMAHGIEARCPFLDHRLVELAAALPQADR